MSVYVMLDFDNVDEAKAFVDAQFGGRLKVDDGTEVWDSSAAVVAVIKKPTRFCECSVGKRVGWTRGKNYGWWVCASCGLPTKLWASRGSWHAFMGLNLIPPEVCTEYRPKGWERSPFTWEFLTKYAPPKEQTTTAGTE